MPLFPPAAGSGAPTTADYLVGTADGTLSAEIVVGTTPGGELGGTWASPTVDATHSGSAHITAAGFGIVGLPTPAVSLTTASAFVTAETTLTAVTYADITGATDIARSGNVARLGDGQRCIADDYRRRDDGRPHRQRQHGHRRNQPTPSRGHRHRSDLGQRDHHGHRLARRDDVVQAARRAAARPRKRATGSPRTATASTPPTTSRTTPTREPASAPSGSHKP